MRAVGMLMRATRKRTFDGPKGGSALLARSKADPTPPKTVTRGLHVTTQQVQGFDVVSLAPRAAHTGGPVVVHLHGGAYVNEVVKQHWQFARAIVDGLKCEVLMPLYGLAPAHDAAEALTLTTTLLDELAAQARAVYLTGDSAGGGLALLTAQHASPTGRAALRGLGLLAPWVDLTMSNPEIELVERRDPWLARAALVHIARTWARSGDLRDPRVSPLFGEFSGLPSVDLWVGDRDICMPDVRKLRDRLCAAGVHVHYTEQPGAIHVYPLLPVPEGRAGRKEVLIRAAGALGITAPA